MKRYLIYGLFGLGLSLAACDTAIVLDLPQGEEDIVIYGFIEQDSLPVVSLTKSLAVFSTIDVSKLQSSFVHNAAVSLNDGDTTIQLVEYNIPLNDFTYYFYSLPSSLINTYKGQVGKSYKLTVQAEGKTLTATTTIPEPLPLDSIWWLPHPDEDNDSLVVLQVRFTDKPHEANYARYFTQRNSEPMYPGYFASVFDDSFLEGQTLDFALPRGQDRNDTINDTYSYFWHGDTILVKWCSIDRAHFDFWMTVETDKNNQGNPFGMPTLIQSNVEGGLGVWGGYGASYHKLIVP
ncbi:MAG: DUF4249 domain-containing protein [Flavobacteriales bacterium]|nr:DUF4249 domain-containing protein [Flavobacteriales bacterium]